MVVSAIVGAWAAVYAGMAVVAACRRPPALRRRGAALRRVLIVRPYAGSSSAVVEAMTTMPAVDRETTVRWIAAVASADDPAVAPLRAAAVMLRERGIAASVEITDARGPNRKAEQIATIAHRYAADYDAVVLVDADVDLRSIDLASLLAPLGGTSDDGRTIGLVWSAPREDASATTGDRASSAILGASWQSFGVLARLDRHVVMGKAIAMRTSDLDAVADLASLRVHLGEDFELGRRFEARGLAVHLATTVGSTASQRALSDVVERYVRWLWVVRAQRPMKLLAYPLLFAAAPLLLLAALALLVHDPTTAVGVAVATVIARHGVAATAAASTHARRSRSALDPWLADAVLLVAFVRACARRSVRWANRTLVVGRDGRLEAPREPA
jgi:ceramide glucosyltransferase